MDDEKQLRLQMLEEVVEDGLDKTFAAAQALHTIHTEGLHIDPGGYETWNTYLEKRWGITKQRAHQLLETVGIRVEPTSLTTPNALEKALAQDEVCPKCLGELDTGWECNDCGFDAIEIVRPPKKDTPT